MDPIAVLTISLEHLEEHVMLEHVISLQCADDILESVLTFSLDFKATGTFSNRCKSHSVQTQARQCHQSLQPSKTLYATAAVKA